MVQVDSWLSTRVSASRWWELLATEACSWDVSTQSLALTRTRVTRASLGQLPRSLQLRLRSQLALELHTPLTLCDVDCRCSRRSHQRSTSTKVQEIASKRSPLRRAWRLACTRVSWQTSCVALVAPSCLSSTTVPRPTSEFEGQIHCGEVLSTLNSEEAPALRACLMSKSLLVNIGSCRDECRDCRRVSSR